MILNQQSFNDAFQHNLKIYKRDLKNKTISFGEYYYVDQNRKKLIIPGIGSMDMLDRLHDIIGACAVGCIPILSKTGTDCVKWVSGRANYFELKTTKTSKNDFFSGTRGGLYSGRNEPGKKMALRSAISAQYNISKSNLKKKNLNTILVVFDRDEWTVIQALRLNRTIVMDYLQNNKITNKKKITPIRQIKLSTFINYGSRIKTEIPSIGIEIWERQIRTLHQAQLKKICISQEMTDEISA